MLSLPRTNSSEIVSLVSAFQSLTGAIVMAQDSRSGAQSVSRPRNANKQGKNPSEQIWRPIFPCAASKAIYGKMWTSKYLCGSTSSALMINIFLSVSFLCWFSSTLLHFVSDIHSPIFSKLWDSPLNLWLCTYSFIHCSLRGTKSVLPGFFCNLVEYPLRLITVPFACT